MSRGYFSKTRTIESGPVAVRDNFMLKGEAMGAYVIKNLPSLAASRSTDSGQYEQDRSIRGLLEV